MRRAIVFLVGAALLLVALLIKAPASLVDGRIDAISAGKVRLVQRDRHALERGRRTATG